MVRIRKATVADAEPLAAVYRSAYQENRELGFPAKAESATADRVSEWIREQRVFVAERDGTIVGGVRVEATAPDRLKVSRLGVDGTHKGDGIGTALLQYVEDWAREEGYPTVWLTTPDEHPYLPGFYRNRGYEKTDDYPLDYRDYDEIVMEKRVR